MHGEAGRPIAAARGADALPGTEKSMIDSVSRKRTCDTLPVIIVTLVFEHVS